jgi:hypothetical protein
LRFDLFSVQVFGLAALDVAGYGGLAAAVCTAAGSRFHLLALWVGVCAFALAQFVRAGVAVYDRVQNDRVRGRSSYADVPVLYDGPAFDRWESNH